MQLQAAKLEATTNEVICLNCNKSITTVTNFAKVQLKSLGQTTKHTKTQQTYAVKCNNCSATGQPSILNDKFICQSCNQEITNLTVHYKNMLKNMLDGSK